MHDSTERDDLCNVRRTTSCGLGCISTAWSPEDIRAHAAEFGPERFAAGLRAEVQRLLAVDKPADAEVGQ